MTRRLQGLSLLLLLLLLLALRAPSVTAAGAAPPRYAALDRYLAAQIGAAHIPGAALGIVQGTRLVHLAGIGRANASGQAMTPQTPVVLGSLSKSVTALAVMQLVQAGRLTLDAPVRRYLPWFALADAGTSAMMPRTGSTVYLRAP